jgi:hypothetical protein
VTRATAAVVACAALVVACKGATPASTPDAATSSSSAPAVAASAPSERPYRPPPVALSCRAIAVAGAVHWLAGDAADAGPIGAPLVSDAELAPHGFLSVATGGRLVVKDPRTSRETTFVGPSRARACVAAREESWLPEGHFESSMGAGEGPGAEEWVITPEAVVRYTAAQLRVDTGGAQTTVAVGAGAAFLWVADDAHASRASVPGPVTVPAPDAGGAAATDDGGGPPDESDLPWRRLFGGAWRIAVPSPVDPHAAVDPCRSRAERAESLAREVLARGDASPDEAGRKVAEQVRERRLARAACALAAVRLAAAPATAHADDADAVRRANELWATVPVAPR